MPPPDDCLIASAKDEQRSVAPALVPIAAAVIGVGAVLFGVISARPTAEAVLDTLVTGSVIPGPAVSPPPPP